MNIHVVNTGYFKLDGGAMFGVVPKSLWNRLNPADENNMCTWAMRCLLIEDGARIILIDTGIGNKQDDKFFSHYYLSGDDTLEKSIAAAGFTPADITDVLLTHLHFDHCGGAVVRKGDDFKPAFPNAVYWSNERHWQWATLPNEREKASFLKENILPLMDSGQLRFIAEGSRTLFSEHITIRFAYGHTDAMMLPQINYRGRTLVFVTDLIPSLAHIPLPYLMSYDMFPLKTLDEKKNFLQEALENNYVLFFEHDPVHECCELTSTEKGVRAGKTFQLVEMPG